MRDRVAVGVRELRLDGGRVGVELEEPRGRAVERTTLRRAISGGKGMTCGQCFALLPMPQFGEENLRCHLASESCGATEWCKMLTTALNNDRPADDRRRVIQADDGSVLDTDTKIRVHFETAIIYASIGTLLATLFDNEPFLSWTREITRGTYRPPSSKWMTVERGPAIGLMLDMLIEEQCKLIEEGREFYKGVAFQHLTFDCWTSRVGQPFLDLDGTVCGAVATEARAHHRRFRRPRTCANQHEPQAYHGPAHRGGGLPWPWRSRR